ncbi:AAA family ATPase [Streptomyces sp. NPDC048442]|uniref:AAA family ATPase n=1 Tax=Streptomyces sp. NPDC048442 TaxID=3154823 RepID=UPI0034354FFB
MKGAVPGGLVGRGRELGALRALLEEHRLVTVVGGAGVGKSALVAVTARTSKGPWRRVVQVRWQGSRRGTPGALAAAVFEAVTGTRPGPEPVEVRALVERLTAEREPEREPKRGREPEREPESKRMPEREPESKRMPEPESESKRKPEREPESKRKPKRKPELRRESRRDSKRKRERERLAAAGVLLVLDDMDLVHRECVGMVQGLLMAVPGLRVLVSSRSVLGLGDEQVLELAPLSTHAPVDGSVHPPAVQLFLDRARAHAHSHAHDHPHAAGLGDELDLPSVTAICRSLEGFPLAIELAAEHLDRHRVGDLAKLLEQDQCWLSRPWSGVRRHRSLRTAVGASYVLCDRAVRIVWGRLSVLSGSFDESTAVVMCAGGSVLAYQVPACLAQLASMHVLEVVRGPGGLREPRYRMLRSARDFGAERLREAQEVEVAAERRALHYRQVSAVAESLWNSGSQTRAMQLVRDEQDDLRATLRHALHHPEHAALALETALNLWFWWAVHGGAEEGRDHLLQLLPLCPTDRELAVRGLWLASWLTSSSDPQGARELLGRAWPKAVLAGDDAAVGWIAHVQGLLALGEGEVRAAAEYFDQAARTVPAQASGGPSAVVSLAALAVARSDFAPRAAQRAARRALTHPGVRSDTWACALARYAQALVDHQHGRSGRAWRRAHRALASLDGTLPGPHGPAALSELFTAIETEAEAEAEAAAGAADGAESAAASCAPSVFLPSMPRPRTAPPLIVPAVTGTVQ